MKTLIAGILAVCLLGGCATIPEMTTHKNIYDDSFTVNQPPVFASTSTLSEWEYSHWLGFDWNSATPQKVFLTVALNEICNIMSLRFKIKDEEIIAEPVTAITDYGSTSKRRFVISLVDFQKIATADLVKMRVGNIGEYSASTFGKSKPQAEINSVFFPFLSEVKRLMARK